VIVGQQHATRYRLAGEIALHLLLPILIGLPLIAIGIWVVVGRALRPVDTVARAVGGLDARHLAPVRIDGPLPAEIAPLVGSLDALVVRLAEALDNERRFTADAAHELRTPLAALRIQAQVACRSVESGARQHALEQVLSGVERMTHLVEQLLTLARLDPDATLPDGVCVDLAEIARSVCSSLAPQALRRDQGLSLDAPDAMPVLGNHWWLEVLVRNLVDNALRYTPVGGRVTVSVRRTDDAVELMVDDNGPGIPPEAHARVFDRFYRLPSDSEGSGLGLAIVREGARGCGASVQLGANPHEPHGLRVTVRFVAAQAAPAAQEKPPRA